MGAGRIKGITIEIEGNTTKLVDSMKKVDSELRKTQTSLRDVNKLLKLDPKNATLLEQKQKQLGQAINQTKTRLQELEAAQEKVDEGTDEWDALQREIIETKNDLDKLEKEYREFGSVAAQQIAATGEKLKSIGGKMQDVGRSMSMYVTAPLVAAGTVGVTKFAEVDKTMQLTNKTMGNTAEQAKLINTAMKDAAANSTFGMNDAATATLNFARAGLKAEEAASTLAPAMNLAAGEGGNLDTVSAGLVATINGFGDSFKNAEHYADVFANACNNSALDIDSLSESMSVAAPIFRTAGYTVNDTALYLGVMANAGIDANEGANSLKTGLARLVSPAKQGAEAMADLGIEVTNADGSMKDSLTVQRELHDAFSGLSESEQIAAASAIFGKNQMSKWLALINTAPEDVAKLSKQLEVEGTTAEMAEAMMSGFGGSMEKLKSSIDVAATSLGEALAPTISKVADKIQTAVDWFNSLDASQQQMIARIGLTVAAIGPALLVGGKLLIGIGQLMTFAPKIAMIGPTIAKGFGLVKTAIGALTFNPVILGITAAVAAGVLIYKNWDKIKAKAAELKASISEKWGNIKTTVKETTGKIAEAGKKILPAFNPAIAAGVLLYKNWDEIKAKAKDLKDKVGQSWDELKEKTSSKWAETKNAISEKMTEASNDAKTKAMMLRNGMTAENEANRKATEQKFEAIKTSISTKLEAAKNAAQTKAMNAKTAMDNAWISAKTSASDHFENLKNNIATKLESAKSSATSKANAIKSSLSSAWDSCKSTAASKFESIKTTITDKLNGAKDSISNIISKIKNKFPFNIGKIIKFSKPSISLNTASKTVLGKTITYPTGFSVNWNRRGYWQPLEFKRPTVMATPYGPQGYGDGPGSEIVMGKNMLLRDFARAAASYANNQYTFNIYARPGQDAEAIAREVEKVLVRNEQKRKAAYA